MRNSTFFNALWIIMFLQSERQLVSYAGKKYWHKECYLILTESCCQNAWNSCKSWVSAWGYNYISLILYHLSVLKLLDAGRYQTPLGSFNYHNFEMLSLLLRLLSLNIHAFCIRWDSIIPFIATLFWRNIFIK